MNSWGKDIANIHLIIQNTLQFNNATLSLKSTGGRIDTDIKTKIL